MGKGARNNKGFDQFVQSIMSKEPKSNKKTLVNQQNQNLLQSQITKDSDKKDFRPQLSTTSNQAVAEKITTLLQAPPQNDADLLRLLNNEGQNIDESKDGARARLKTIGLGYGKGASAAQLESLATLQGLKQKYGGKLPTDQKDAKPKIQRNDDESKFALSKKITKTEQDKLIDEKKEKIQLRLQKAEAVNLFAKPVAEAEETAAKSHFKKRDLKKTRSKLKNRRKDNRPAEMLQKKFGSILNVD